MRSKSATILAALALLFLVSARAQTQQQDQKDDKIIDDFVTTRGFIFNSAKPAAKPTPASSRRRQGSSVASTKKNATNGAKQGGGTAGSTDVAKQNSGTPDAATGSASTDGDATDNSAQFIKASTLMNTLALGYTIYMKDSTGALLAVPTSKTYKTGDRIAIVLETVMDGYLYIFNAENGKNPLMLYPNVLLDKGQNAVRSHVRETYPADLDQAFEFVDPPAPEHVYIVVSRDPLPGIPTGDALDAYCGKNRADCYYRPTAAQWTRITAAALDRRVTEAQSTQIAQLNTQPVMPAMLQRGIKIKKEEPAPAILRVAYSPTEKMLVTKIELTHK